jgi:hypothetical protein
VPTIAVIALASLLIAFAPAATAHRRPVLITPRQMQAVFEEDMALSRMLPSVRPVMQRWSCGPLWECEGTLHQFMHEKS